MWGYLLGGTKGGHDRHVYLFKIFILHTFPLTKGSRYLTFLPPIPSLSPHSQPIAHLVIPQLPSSSCCFLCLSSLHPPIHTNLMPPLSDYLNFEWCDESEDIFSPVTHIILELGEGGGHLVKFLSRRIKKVLFQKYVLMW